MNRQDAKDAKKSQSESMELDVIGSIIIDAAVKVHTALGPGLLESVYQTCLAYELRKRGLKVDCEVVQPVSYEEVSIDAGYRIDMIVEDKVLIENKAVEKVLPVHEAQLLTYLKLRGCSLGIF